MSSKKVNICFLLLALSLTFLLFGVLGNGQQVEVEAEPTTITPVATPTPIPTPVIIEEQPIPETIEWYQETKRRLGEVTLTCIDVILVNEYRVFLTAYCSEECGYRVYEDGTDNYPTGHITSTGTICHRSSELMRYEPSTCGVDPHYFKYGTMFYVPSEDRVYIAEDTGYISGLWIDTYQTSMETMSAYDVRYENVWTVELEYYEVSSSIYHVQDKINDYQRNSI